jgi:hypothetical protein
MMEPLHGLTLIGVTLLGTFWSGCGSRDIETIEAPPGCPLPPTLPPPVSARLLDDLEDGDYHLIKGDDGLDGAWELWDDKTNPGLLTTVSANCAAFGKFALHVKSEGQTDWGASINLFFRSSPPRPRPYDGSRFNAVSFYAAATPSQGPLASKKVGISTMDTAWEGNCSQCTDNFGKRITIDHRWQRFVLPFSELIQEGWGQPNNVPFKTNEIVQIALQLGSKFDLWVDQVAFEKL